MYVHVQFNKINLMKKNLQYSSNNSKLLFYWLQNKLICEVVGFKLQKFRSRSSVQETQVQLKQIILFVYFTISCYCCSLRTHSQQKCKIYVRVSSIHYCFCYLPVGLSRECRVRRRCNVLLGHRRRWETRGCLCGACAGRPRPLPARNHARASFTPLVPHPQFLD